MWPSSGRCCRTCAAARASPWPAHPVDGFIPADLAARLLRLLDGGAELVRGQAARIRNAIDPNGPTTPVLAVLVLGWLEAAAQVLAAGSSSQELQELLSVADRHGQLP